METVLSSQQLHRWSLSLTAEMRGRSLHLTFLYLPPAPTTTIQKTGKPKYLPLGLGTQADTKTRGWSSYTGPQSCRWSWCCRYCLVHQTLHFRCFYKRLLLERRELRGCPLPASLNQPELPASPPAGERPPRSPLTAPTSPHDHPQLGLFL